MVKLLVADDNHLIATTLSAILRQQQYAVSTATSLGEAERIANELHPDLVLLDVNFGPDHSLDLARRLKERGYNVVLISGEGSTADLLESHGWTADTGLRALPKPIHPLELLREIDVALANSRTGEVRKRHA